MWAALLGGLALLLTVGIVDGRADDRLTRFRDLGRTLSGLGESGPAVDGEAVLAEMFALADAEIMDSLKAGEPFASAAFIQERLDAFMATWGGAGLRIHRVGRPGETPPLTVGVFSAPGPAPRGWIRIYGSRPDGQPGLLATSAHDGAPEIYAWPAARDGATQFAATWVGAASGSSGRPVVIELWRRARGEGIERIWSSAAAFPDGLWVLGLIVKGGAITIRHEARYPGWNPGCSGQTELTDVYRWDPARGRPALASRRVANGWHRELHAAVGRLLTALAAGDTAALAELVPERALRTRLPKALAREPACDAPNSATPSTVAVAATEGRGARLVPWSLAWRRTPKGWRLASAAPMLE